MAEEGGCAETEEQRKASLSLKAVWIYLRAAEAGSRPVDVSVFGPPDGCMPMAYFLHSDLEESHNAYPDRDFAYDES